MAMKQNKSECSCIETQSCLLCRSFVEIEKDCEKEGKIGLFYCLKCAMVHVNDGDCEFTSRVCFHGIYIKEDFLSEKEESQLINNIDQVPWVSSQGGRMKQDYGPKVNFKKRKIKCDAFTGLPNYSKGFYERMLTQDIMKDFKPVEMCNLDYDSKRGSLITPHYDDTWIWGDRLVTLNLLSDSILTFTHKDLNNIEVQVRMPRRCLIVVHGDARYRWKHEIHPEDITERRIALTMRELTPEFLPGGQNQDLGAGLLETALTFNGCSVSEFGRSL